MPFPPLTERDNKNTINTLMIPQHYVGIHPKQYNEQPKNAEMGRITNYFKKQGFARKANLLEIFTASSNGHTILPANFEVEYEHDKGTLGTMRFVSSTLILIDVDDDAYMTNPSDLLDQLKGKCAGLFYTFSNRIKGQRYRLVFSLDRAITDYDIYKAVVVQLAEEIERLIVTPEQRIQPNFVSPIDMQPRNALLPVRTGREQAVISDLQAQLNVEEYVNRARQEKIRRAELAKESFESGMKYKYTFAELKEMAETIGYIPSGTGMGQLWKTVVVGLKHYENTGSISPEEGFELFDIISGGEQPYKNWANMKASGQATIGSFVKLAQDKGYKRKGYRYALTESAETHKIERHKVKQHIPTELAVEFVERKKRILLESPTGSGKSTSFLNAAKKLATADQFRFFIFSAPTRALAEQLGRKHNVTVVKGNTKNLFSEILNSQKRGNRIFIATFDMTETLMHWLSNLNQFASFVLIVDEYHKSVTDYSSSYRRETINALHRASKRASSFIALSGTPEEILKDDFEQVVAIDNGQSASPCQEFAVYTYEKQKDALPMLVQLIEAWTVKRKLLIYIQSKEVLGKLYDLLRKRGIVTRTVSASEKRNNTYKTLVEKEMVPDEVQVVLCTSVIADGINIQNSLEWECIVVANHFSNLFNASTLKQASNRFRNEYRRFSVFMQEPIIQETDLFNIDSAYRYVHRIAERFASQLNNEFGIKELDLFRASVIEKKYGIQATEDGISVDTFYLRYEASKAQENYYKGRRTAFIRSLEKVLHKKSAGMLNINEAVRENKLDLSLIEQEISELNEQIELSREERKEGLVHAFTREVYVAFHEDNSELLDQFKEQVLPEHFACIQGLYRYASFDVCQQIVVNVKRKADTHSFMNRIRAIVDIWYFASFNRRTETKKTYEAFVEATSNVMESAELKALTMQIVRKQKITEDVAKQVMNRFFFQINTRDKETRYTQLEVISVESVAKEHRLPVSAVVDCIEMYANTQKKVIRTAVANRLVNLRDEQLNLKLG